MAEEAISQPTVPHDRERRPNFSAVMHVFNISSYDAQGKLQSTVKGIRDEQLSTAGEVLRLTLVIYICLTTLNNYKHLQGKLMK